MQLLHCFDFMGHPQHRYLQGYFPATGAKTKQSDRGLFCSIFVLLSGYLLVMWTLPVFCAKKSFSLKRSTLMVANKRRLRRDWSRQDVGQLKSLARRRTPARVIGRRLRRSEGAVRQKAFALGVSLDTRARRRRK